MKTLRILASSCGSLFAYIAVSVAAILTFGAVLFLSTGIPALILGALGYAVATLAFHAAVGFWPCVLCALLGIFVVRLFK